MGKMENLVAKFVAKFLAYPYVFACIQMRGVNQQTERVKPSANPQKQKGLRLQTLYLSVAVQAGIEPATK